MALPVASVIPHLHGCNNPQTGQILLNSFYTDFREFTLSSLSPLSEVSVAGHFDLLVFLAAKQILKLSILTFSQLGIIVNRGILKEVQEHKVHLAGNSKV